MKKLFLFTVLFSSLIYSCSSDLEETTVANQQETVQKDILLHRQMEDFIISEGTNDLNALFVFHLSTVGHILEKGSYQDTELSYFVDDYYHVDLSELLSSFVEQSVLDQSTKQVIQDTYEEMTRKADLIDRIAFIQEFVGESKPEQFTTILFKGYQNWLLKIQQADFSSRDCIDDCIDVNLYTGIWYSTYNWYVDNYPRNCPGATQGVYNCNAALNYAYQQIYFICLEECEEAEEEEIVNVNPCAGVICVPGYYCEEGECIDDPTFNPCAFNGGCPPGEYCLNGECIPW